MGKKSKSKRVVLNRRETIKARQSDKNKNKNKNKNKTEITLGEEEPRVDCDTLKQAFLKISKDDNNKWDPTRVALIQYYVDTMVTKGLMMNDNHKEKIMQQKNDDPYEVLKFVNQDDKTFLKNIIKDPTELITIRVMANHAMAVYNQRNLNYEEALQTCRRTIELANKATPQEMELKSHGDNDITFGDIIHDRKRMALALFVMLRRLGMTYHHHHHHHHSPACQSEEEGEGEGEGLAAAAAAAEHHHRVLLQQALQVQTSTWPLVGGDKCDFCGKTATECHGGNNKMILDCCPHCKMTYYCSRSCQEQDWKHNNHKMECRRRGEFKPGDIVQYAGPTVTCSTNTCPIPFGSSVRIAMPGPNEKVGDDLIRPKHWIVSTAPEHWELNMDPVGNERGCVVVVSAKDLRVMRPKNRDFFERVEKEERFLVSRVVQDDARTALEAGTMTPTEALSKIEIAHHLLKSWVMSVPKRKKLELALQDALQRITVTQQAVAALHCIGGNGSGSAGAGTSATTATKLLNSSEMKHAIQIVQRAAMYYGVPLDTITWIPTIPQCSREEQEEEEEVISSSESNNNDNNDESASTIIVTLVAEGTTTTTTTIVGEEEENVVGDHSSEQELVLVQDVERMKVLKGGGGDPPLPVAEESSGHWKVTSIMEDLD